METDMLTTPEVEQLGFQFEPELGAEELLSHALKIAQVDPETAIAVLFEAEQRAKWPGKQD